MARLIHQSPIIGMIFIITLSFICVANSHIQTPSDSRSPIQTDKSIANAHDRLLEEIQANCPKEISTIMNLINNRQDKEVFRLLLVGTLCISNTALAQALAAESGLPFVLVDCEMIAQDKESDGTDLLTIATPYIDKDEPTIVVIAAIDSLPAESVISLLERYKNKSNLILIATAHTPAAIKQLEPLFNHVLNISLPSQELKSPSTQNESRPQRTALTYCKDNALPLATIVTLAAACTAGLIINYKLLQSSIAQQVSGLTTQNKYFQQLLEQQTKQLNNERKATKRERIIQQAKGLRYLRGNKLISQERDDLLAYALKCKWKNTWINKSDPLYVEYKILAGNLILKEKALFDIEEIKEQLKSSTISAEKQASLKKELEDLEMYNNMLASQINTSIESIQLSPSDQVKNILKHLEYYLLLSRDS